MKIAVVQTKPSPEDIPTNIKGHERFESTAASLGADLIIFPELSDTGYEPTNAIDYTSDRHDSRFDLLQEISDNHNITLGIGAPTKYSGSVCISLLLFHPGQQRQIYSKMYLHSDEEPFFIPGPSSTSLVGNNPSIALAICYELSVPQHANDAAKNGAEIYLASVAKTADGVEKAISRLS